MCNRHYLGPGFRCAETVMTPCLTDAVMKCVKVRGKTALRWECELLYNQNCVNVMGSQPFRAAGSFSRLKYIAFITACQSVSKGVHVRANGVPPISVSSSECLFRRLQLNLGF